MRVTITGRHVEVTVALRRHVETRLKRLERYGMKLDDVQVVLAVEKYRHAAEIILSVNGAVLQAKISTTEMYGSIDQLVDKIGRQMLKRKEKLTNHKVKAVSRGVSPVPSGRKRTGPQFDRVLAPLHSLTPDEAIHRLGLHPSALLIFREPATDRIQVVRRLEDGAIQLIDPQPI